MYKVFTWSLSLTLGHSWYALTDLWWLQMPLCQNSTRPSANVILIRLRLSCCINDITHRTNVVKAFTQLVFARSVKGSAALSFLVFNEFAVTAITRCDSDLVLGYFTGSVQGFLLSFTQVDRVAPCRAIRVASNAGNSSPSRENVRWPRQLHSLVFFLTNYMTKGHKKSTNMLGAWGLGLEYHGAPNNKGRE